MRPSNIISIKSRLLSVQYFVLWSLMVNRFNCKNIEIENIEIENNSYLNFVILI